jgi:hypothetical protein
MEKLAARVVVLMEVAATLKAAHYSIVTVQVSSETFKHYQLSKIRRATEPLLSG